MFKVIILLKYGILILPNSELILELNRKQTAKYTIEIQILELFYQLKNSYFC